MNKKIAQIAKKSGFVFWGNEAWGPGKGKIDWSTDYAKEFDTYTKLLMKETVKWINDNVGLITPEAQADLNKHFGVDE